MNYGASYQAQLASRISSLYATLDNSILETAILMLTDNTNGDLKPEYTIEINGSLAIKNDSVDTYTTSKLTTNAILGFVVSVSYFDYGGGTHSIRITPNI